MSSYNRGGDRHYRDRDPRERSPSRHHGDHRSRDEPRNTRSERSVKIEMNWITKLTDSAGLNIVEVMAHILEIGMLAAEHTKSLFQARFCVTYPMSCRFHQTSGQLSDWRSKNPTGR